MKIDAPLSPTTAIEFSIASTGRELVPVRSTPTLEERAGSINSHIHKYTSADMSGHKHRLKAGTELLEARKLIPHGEWLAWCEKNIVRGQRDIQRLMKMASADDPEAALEQERAETRERVDTPYVRRSSDDAENRDCDPVALRIHFSRFVRTRGVLQPVLTPAELFAAVAPALDAMSDDAVREYGKMVTDYLIDRPEPSAAA